MRLKSTDQPPRYANLFEPFATIISFMLALVAGIVVVFGLTTAFGSGSLLGLGDSSVCVTGRPGAYIPDQESLPPFLKPGVRLSMTELDVCQDDAGPGLQALHVATRLPSFLVYTGALVLLWRLVRAAMRFGPFSRVNARRLRFIGWWVGGGGAVAVICERTAHWALAQRMFKDGPELVATVTAAIPWTLIVTGVGLLTVARILEVGVRMHEDLEGTV
ncbi:DUF2975 domain-containing protein [Actinomadura fulvescens]|uniref:DUF2975 domain-containing protein n=1 Tax=Actinomadura fulvescens TaxID=46160 RepID=A0ABN3QE25_9ACTN